MKDKTLKLYMKKAAGYTIDQTILIVAVIAILITLIIASVGWDLLNRTSGTKLASYLKQIEEANGAFYARQGVWPHVAVLDGGTAAAQGAAPANNIGILASSQPITPGNDYDLRYKPFLTGFDVDLGVADQALVYHEFASGGLVSQDIEAGGGICDPVKDVLMITMVGIPEAELENADDAIDGEIDATAGRLQWTNLAGGTADLTYCANLLN